MGKLQPLGGVDGHHTHLVPSFAGIAVGEEGHVGQVMLQGDLLAAGGFICIDGLLELGQIVQPFLASLCSEHPLVAALLEHGSEHLRDRPSLRLGGEALHEVYKLSGFGALKKLLLQVVQKGLVQGAIVGSGIVPEGRHAALTQVSLGHVGHPQKGEVVPVDQHTQVGDGVPDLHAAIKLYAAIDGIGDLGAKKSLFHRPGDVMGPVEDSHVLPGDASLMKGAELFHHPFGLLFLGIGQMATDRSPGGQGGNEVFFYPVLVFVDERVGRR